MQRGRTRGQGQNKFYTLTIRTKQGGQKDSSAVAFRFHPWPDKGTARLWPSDSGQTLAHAYSTPDTPPCPRTGGGHRGGHTRCARHKGVTASATLDHTLPTLTSLAMTRRRGGAGPAHLLAQLRTLKTSKTPEKPRGQSHFAQVKN